VTQEEYETAKADFDYTVDLVRLEAYSATGYEWMVVPSTGANRTIKAQHGLFIQPTDGIDNDGDGYVDEPDEFVTRADGGQSPHNFDLARDITPCKKSNVPWWPNGDNPLWLTMGKIAEKHGLVWGGRWTKPFDAPHIEAANWRQARAAWKAGQLNVA